MLAGIIIWFLLMLVSMTMIERLKNLYGRVNLGFCRLLFFYHSLLAVAYYLYALSNPSDSINFYQKAMNKVHGSNWFDYYGNSTKFIDFITYSLVNHFGFNYEACMVFFAWLGFLGFLSFYLFLSEKLHPMVRIFDQPALYVLLLLPNLHFWSSSLGKGSIMFFGFGLFFYGLNRPLPRLWALVTGGWIIYQIRPHIFFVVMIAVAVGFTFSTRGLAAGYRIAVLTVAGLLLYYIYEDILQITGLEDESILDPLISHRASELAKATSGIDITSYSVPEKLFAFWFRPLFFDAPGALGLIVSFENAFYLFFFLRLFQPRAIRFLIESDAIVKTCLVSFLGVSLALAQISGNLGLAMRQKSQVMILMLFVIAKYLESEKIKTFQARAARAKYRMQTLPAQTK